MRKSAPLFSISLALAVLILASCVQPMAPAAKTGAISFAVAAYNPAVAEAYASSHKMAAPAAKATQSRAFLSAGRVDFRVTDPSGITTFDSWTVNPALTPQSSASAAGSLGTRNFNAGSYILYASVYNNSADTMPAVGGSQSFTVVAGQPAGSSPVIVNCLPSSPTYLSVGYSSSSPALLNTWAISAGPPITVTTVGSEAWYSVYATSISTNFAVTPDSPSGGAQPYLFLFDSYGTSLSSTSASSQGGVARFQAYGTIANTTYYLCVIDGGVQNSPSRSYSVLASNYVAPPGTTISVTPSLVAATPAQTTPANWTTGTLTSTNTVLWYVLTTTPGDNFNIWWNDAYQGSAAYTGSPYNFFGPGLGVDIKVSAYSQDMTPYFTGVDSGYLASQNVNSGAGNTTIYIKVEPFSVGNVGTFGLSVSKVLTPTPVVISPAMTRTMRPDPLTPYRIGAPGLPSTPGAPLWFAVSAATIGDYYLWWDDSWSGSGTYSTALGGLDVKVSAYSPDGTAYWTGVDSGYSNSPPNTVTTTTAGDTIFVKIESFYSSGSNVSGTFAFGASQ